MDEEFGVNEGSIEKAKVELENPAADSKVAEGGSVPESRSSVIELSGSLKVPKRKGTGPRTKLGKQRSSRNAIRHGVYSRNFLLPGESPSEFKRLLAALRKEYQPESLVQELKLRDLAFQELSKQRLRLVEWAVVKMQMEFVEWDQQNSFEQRETPQEAKLFTEILDIGSNQGLIHEIRDVAVLRRIVKLLVGLQTDIAAKGFNLEQDKNILEQIYGPLDPNRLREDLHEFYDCWVSTAIQEEGEREDCMPVVDCREKVIRQIAKEVRRLRRYAKEQASMQAFRTRLQIFCGAVPDGVALDKCLRYRKAIERSGKNTRQELSDLQRNRHHQSLEPTPAVQGGRA